MTVIGSGATASRSNAIFLGRADGSDTTIAQGNFEVNGTILYILTYTIATLPTAVGIKKSFATNGRKSGEGVGAGTGIPVWSDGTNWRTYYDNSIAAA
jgi:hypothetical protein